MRRIDLGQTTLVALVAIILVCGAIGVSEAKNRYNKHRYNLSDYVLLDTGNEWTFETIVQSRGTVLDRSEDTWVVSGRESTGKRTCCAKMATRIDMGEVSTFSPTGRPPRLYMALTDHKFVVYGHDLPGDCDLPRLELPAVVQIGDDDEKRTSVVGPIRMDSHRGKTEARKWDCELTVESCDRVIVPAGAFNDCIQLSLIVKDREDDFRTIMDWRVWYAKDVGPIESLLTCEGYPASAGPIKVQEELISARLGDLIIGDVEEK